MDADADVVAAKREFERLMQAAADILDAVDRGEVVDVPAAHREAHCLMDEADRLVAIVRLAGPIDPGATRH